MLINDPPVEITDNLRMLGTNAYPIFLYTSDGEAAVFEGSIGAMGPLVGEQMRQLDIPAESVKQIVVTHAHPDHVMAVPAMREMFPGATVLASAIAAKTLSIDKAVGFFCKIDGSLTEALLANGLITEAHRPQPLAEMRIPIDTVIAEGHTVAVGGATFTVLETPGHSDCSLSFHEPAAGVLIISDATGYYVPQDNYWWPNYFTNYETYLASMRRLAALGAEVLCLSHNGAIKGADDVRAYFDGAIAATEAYHARIVDELKAGKDARAVAEQLGSEVYEKTQLLPVTFFQKNCSVLVKQSMQHEGIADDE